MAAPGSMSRYFISDNVPEFLADFVVFFFQRHPTNQLSIPFCPPCSYHAPALHTMHTDFHTVPTILQPWRAFRGKFFVVRKFRSAQRRCGLSQFFVLSSLLHKKLSKCAILGGSLAPSGHDETRGTGECRCARRNSIC